MAQGFYGADPEQLRALAKQFSSGSNQIRSSLETVSSLVNSTQSWQGPDASAFQQRWNSQVKQLGNTVVHALELGSTTLIKNADEQTATSQVDGGAGGNGGSSGGGHSGGGGGGGGGGGLPGTLSFRDVWNKWGELKNTISLPKNLLGMGLMMRQGADAFYDSGAWKNLPNMSSLYGGLDDAGNILGLKNLNKYVPALKWAGGFLEETPTFFTEKGEYLKSLGMGGLGRTLGWAGVGLNVIDAVNHARAGEGVEAMGSVAKAALGVACFLPPPVGTVAQIGSVVLAVYEIPAVKTFVNDTAANVGNFIADTAKNNAKNLVNSVVETGKFVSSVGDGIQDLGKGVGDFFGWN